MFPVFFEAQELSLYERGKNEFMISDYSGALNHFLKIHDNVPGDVNYLIAMSYFNLKKYKEAIPYFNAEIKNNGSNINARLKKAESERYLKKYAAAVTDLKNILKLKPDYFIAYYMMGQIFSDQKEFKKAVDSFLDAIKLHPGFEKAYYEMGFCYLNLNDTVAACNCWKELEDPDDFENYKTIEKVCK